MQAPRHILRWADINYPYPKVDPQWLADCYDWCVNTENINPTTELPRLMQEMEKQLLSSSLSDSMLPGTGLPNDLRAIRVHTIKGPVLVEITDMTEMGHSALGLLQTMDRRAERIAAGAPEDDDDPGDWEDVDGEGPVPKYPRSMLRFQLSDGSVTLQASEYRRMPELELGKTPLGHKMILQNVTVRRGLAFLEPKCVVHKYHQTDTLVEQQQALFAAGLRARLMPPQDEQTEPPRPGQNARPAGQPPIAPRTREPRSPPPVQQPIAQPKPPSTQGASTRATASSSTPISSAVCNNGTQVTSPYFSTSASGSSAIGPANTNVSGSSILRLSPTRTGPFIIPDDDDDDDMKAQVDDTATKRCQAKGKGRAQDIPKHASQRAPSILEQNYGVDGKEIWVRRGKDIQPIQQVGHPGLGDGIVAAAMLVDDEPEHPSSDSEAGYFAPMDESVFEALDDAESKHFAGVEKAQSQTATLSQGGRAQPLVPRASVISICSSDEDEEKENFSTQRPQKKHGHHVKVDDVIDISD